MSQKGSKVTLTSYLEFMLRASEPDYDGQVDNRLARPDLLRDRRIAGVGAATHEDRFSVFTFFESRCPG